jgi:transcriptional regulator with XRE-family HTH domain
MKNPNLKKLRRKYKLSQESMARLLGTSRPRYQEIEDGLTRATPEELKRLTEILQCTIEEISAAKERGPLEGIRELWKKLWG